MTSNINSKNKRRGVGRPATGHNQTVVRIQKSDYAILKNFAKQKNKSIAEILSWLITSIKIVDNN